MRLQRKSIEIVVALACAIGSLGLAYFTIFSSTAKDLEARRLHDLYTVKATMPRYPDFRDAGTSEYSKLTFASISTSYRTDASYAQVRAFYLENLPRDGWTMAGEIDLPDIGDNQSEKRINFKRGDFCLVLIYTTHKYKLHNDPDRSGYTFVIRSPDCLF